MTTLDVWQRVLELLVTLAAPFLITALVVGVGIALLQTATQLQEAVLSFVPKLAAAILVLVLAGGWLIDRIGQFTTAAFTAVPQASVDEGRP